MGSVAACFDREVEEYMQARGVPGGALAVVKGGRLVYARGYGWADRDKKIPARPDTLFRIASISKTFTGVATLRLMEEKKLELDARAFDIIRLNPLPGAEKKRDSRLAGITVRQLLQHTGGWDRDKSFDPMFRSREIARAAGVPSPAGQSEIIRYMLSQPLDSDPGRAFAYSNFGYCLLGRIIEKISGRPYDTFVREKVLTPLGIQRMRLGRTRDGQQAEDEARYYNTSDEVTESVWDGSTKNVPWPYGGFCLESMDSHGGWIASAVELARYAAAFNNPEACPFLKGATIRTMQAPPPPPASRKANGEVEDHYYGCGWNVRPVGKEGRANYWHTGSLPGTFTILVRRSDGLSWAALFNLRVEDSKLSSNAIDPALHRAANAVKEWPSEDLFPTWQPRL